MKIRHQFRVCVSTGVLEDWGPRDLCCVLSVLTPLTVRPLTVRPLTLLPPHGPTTFLLSGTGQWKIFHLRNIFLMRCIKKMEHCYHCNAIQYDVSLRSLDIFVRYHISIFFFLHFFASNVMLGLKSHPYNGNQLPAWGWTFFYRPGQYVCSCVGVIPWIIIYFWI